MCYTIVTVRGSEPNRAAAVKRVKGDTMKLSKIWQTVVKSQEDISYSYAKSIKGFNPLKCRFMAVCTPDNQMKIYWGLKECICYDGVDYTIDHITMHMNEDEFTIYVYVK